MNDILRVDPYDTNTEYDILINEVLIDKGFAVKCEEPYQSKVTLQKYFIHTFTQNEQLFCELYLLIVHKDDHM